MQIQITSKKLFTQSRKSSFFLGLSVFGLNLSCAYAQMPELGTVRLTDGAIYFVQTGEYNTATPFVSLNIGAVHNPDGGPGNYDAEYLEISAPRSIPMNVDIDRVCRRFTNGMIDCHVQYPLSTLDMSEDEVTLTGRYYSERTLPAFEAMLMRNKVVTGQAGTVGRPEASPDLSGNRPPIANAGGDITTSRTSAFWLDGRGSTDPDGDKLTYKWEQISGPGIKLSQPNGAMALYWPSHGTRQFRLTVTDLYGNVSMPDEVTITHEPRPAAAQCDIWGRDDLVESLTASQPGGLMANHGMKLNLSASKTAAIQSEAARLDQLYPNFGSIEIGAVVSPTKGGGLLQVPIQRDSLAATIPGAAPVAIRFEGSGSASVPIFWTDEPFAANRSYHIQTTVKLLDENAQEISNSELSSDCRSAEVFAKVVPMAGKIIGGQGAPIRGPLFVISDGVEQLRQREISDFPKPRHGPIDPNGPIPQ